MEKAKNSNDAGKTCTKNVLLVCLLKYTDYFCEVTQEIDYCGCLEGGDLDGYSTRSGKEDLFLLYALLCLLNLNLC